MANSTVLVIGTIGIDCLEMPDGTRHEQLLGGSAWFAALAAARFSHVEMVAAVGYDFTEAYRAILRERSIGVAGLHTVPDRPTFAWAARYSEGFRERETTQLDNNALDAFDPVIPESARSSQYAMICNFDPGIQSRALAQLEPDCFVMLDTIDHWILKKRSAVDALIARSDLLLVNNEEATLLTGIVDCEASGRALLVAGAGAVIVKQGSDGSLLVHPEGVAFVPICEAAQLCDPTGAGDTYGGAILGYLASTGRHDFDTIQEAMRWGAALASFTVEAMSSDRLLTVTDKELTQRYQHGA